MVGTSDLLAIFNAMNTYTVLIRAYTTVVVEAETQDAALEIAREAAAVWEPSGWEIEDRRIDDTLNDAKDIERAIRHSPHHKAERKTTPYR